MATSSSHPRDAAAAAPMTHRVELAGGRIEARTTIRAAGVHASPLGALLAGRSGARLDRGGRDRARAARPSRSAAVRVPRPRKPGRGLALVRRRAARTDPALRLPAWLLWLVVHLAFLTGFRNRVSAVFHWAISFAGRGRAERTTTLQQVRARRSLERASRPRAEGLVARPQGAGELRRHGP